MAEPSRAVRRRDVEGLSPDQLHRLRGAFAQMMAAGGQGGFAYWAGIHGAPPPIYGPHHEPGRGFLPWHRAYLYLFEEALRSFDASVFLPWWDWATGPGRAGIPSAFADAEDSAGGENPLYAGAIPEIEGVEGTPRRTARDPGDPKWLPDVDELRRVLAVPDFGEFSDMLENLHDSVHGWVGGDMGSISTSQYDPLAWSLSVTVDRVWHAWQLQHPNAEWPKGFLEAELAPFGMVVRDVLDVRQLGYDYSPFRLGAGGASLTHYASDLVDLRQRADDLLDLDPEVDALASLITQRAVHPPLAVGLFGDWGSGKSFFMRLMAQRVEEIAAASGTVAPDSSAFCSEVRQITFNAWHYADANLWASLVAELFSRLAETDAEEELPSGLASMRDRRREIEQQAASAASERASAEADLKRLRAARRESSPAAALRNARQVAGLAEDPEVRAFIARLDEVDATASEVADRALDATSLVNRLSGIFAYLRAHRLALAVTVAGLVLVGIGAVLLGDQLGKLILGVGGVLTFISGLLRPLQQIESAAKVRDDVNARLATKLWEQEQAAEHRRDDAAAAESEAQTQLDRLATGAGLQAFLSERAASNDYRSQLGLVALVRRDLEQLSAALREQDSPIERVILYIDDLDRCPAPRVVEVLEAVHLLLAFDLFVVVVGVDSRWLLSSLRHVYAAQFGTAAVDEASWATTPQNYLEKIFQIPYAVPVLEPDGFRNFVDEILAPDMAPGLHTGQVEQEGAAADREAPGEPISAGADDDESMEAEEEERPRRQVELRPRSLEIQPEEASFLASLGELVPSPRAGKRLINTYRLLRAPLSEDELEALEGEEGEHRVVACLLAIMIGFPALAPRVFGAILAESDDTPWKAFVDRVSNHAPSNVHGDDWPRLGAALHYFDDRFGVDEPLKPFRRWVPRVARYAFETSRLTADPLQ